MKRDVVEHAICSMMWNSSDVVLFQNLIDHNYNHNWVFGDVSATPFPVGNHDVHGYHIYDHFNITIHYRKPSKNLRHRDIRNETFRIHSVTVEPVSKQLLLAREREMSLP
jgi:hypothetical protein